jgi:hypothetical protein
LHSDDECLLLLNLIPAHENPFEWLFVMFGLLLVMLHKDVTSWSCLIIVASVMFGCS